MVNKIKAVGGILKALYVMVVVHVIMLPALLVGCFAILILAFDFEYVREFSDDSDLTSIWSGQILRQGLDSIRQGIDLLVWGE